MKVAYLILAHAHPRRLRKLVDAIAAPWADIFVHIDQKAELAPFVEACRGTDARFHEPRIKTQWCGWSVMQAQLDMLRRVRSPKYKYYKLLSGDCHPVKSREQIYEFLASNEENFQLFWPRPDITLRSHPVDFYHFADAIPMENFLRKDRFRVRPLHWFLRHPLQITYWGLFHLLIHTDYLSRIRDLIPRRKRPIKVYGGEMWWCLRHEFVEYLLDFCEKRPDAIRYFQYVRPPDEHTIPSVLIHSGMPFKELIIHLNHQKLLTEEALEEYREREHALFARKFDERLIAFLERKLQEGDRNDPTPTAADGLRGKSGADGE